MRRRPAFLILIVLVCLFALQGVASETVEYYYLNACEACDPEEAFAKTLMRVAGIAAGDVDVEYHNVYTDKGRAAYERATQGMTESERGLPLLILDGKVYAGDAKVAAGLTARFGAARTDNRSILYFLTAPSCGGCTAARETMDALPAVVALDVDGATVSSPVEIREVSIAAEPDLAQALFRHYNVPDENRYAPAVFLGTTVLSGAKQIRAQVPGLVKSGAALSTPELDPAAGAESIPAEAGGPMLLGAVIAGLAAGFNPCALSMLLAFAGALLAIRRAPIVPGLLYLLGKLSVYLGIGFLFADLWTRYAPGWLPLASRILATGIGAVLIVLNLADAANIRAERYGSVRNQLPAGLRGRLRNLIGRWARIRGAGLAAVAVLLGAVIAAGEFLCAGQLYVAVLIANARNPGAKLPLILYCAAFLLPSLALTIVVSVSRKTFSSSDWVLKHMSAFKLLTAAVMAALVLSIWLMK